MTENRDYVQELVGQLQSDQLPLIDFDQLKDWLARSAKWMDEALATKQSAEPLRRDYESRIAGMAKGIAAADRKRDSVDEALRLVEQLPTMSGEQLVACYRHTAARFRDAFPTSFGYLGSGSIPRSEKLTVYKS